MRVSGFVAAAGLVMSATTAMAEPRTITQPDWLTQPTGDTLDEHYPMLATMLDIEGTAQISCKVTDKGLLEACAVDTEAPAGFGFGGAALAMSSAFRMKPQTIDGQPVSGGVVCIPLKFVLPPLPAADAVPTPSAVADAQTRAAALRLVEGGAAAVEAAHRTQRAALLANTKADADAVTREAAARALDAALDSNRSRLRQVMVDVVLAMLTPEEIQSIDALSAATAGMTERDLSRLQSDLTTRIPAYISRAIRSEFCKDGLCRGTPAELAAVAAAPGGGVAEVANWKAAPTADQIKAAMPSTANLLGVTGAARLTCDARPDGALHGCVVAAEGPARWGFGEAAERLASSYRLEAADTRAHAARRVALRVEFRPAEAAPVETPPTPSSPAAKALARTLIETMTPPTQFDRQLNGLVMLIKVQLDPSVAPTAEHALRGAFQRTMDLLIDDAASMVAAQYSEAELSPMVAFMTSPAGRSARTKMPGLQGPMTSAVLRHQAVVLAIARAEFCAGRACPPARHLPPRRPQPAAAASPEASTRKP